MSDFKAKMHQIRFRLGLRPRPRWGAHSAPPDSLAEFKGSYYGTGWKGKGREEKREGREKGGEDGATGGWRG